MFYREAGQYKTTYAADMAIFPIRQDRYGMALILVVAFVLIPVFGNQFFLNTMMIPFLTLSLGAIGLNLLTGYTGLLSLGSGAFMGVGAYACYKLETIFPQVNILVWTIVSGVFSALVGVVFGLPSLRIKGFYLAVATLAAQFFLQWCFARAPWLVNYNDSGAIVGGLIIGVGEKLGEFYWGPLVGGGIESWLAYVIALAFLLVRPQGLFGERIIERI